jgi:transcriptional regulator with XRE-family HTH domain
VTWAPSTDHDPRQVVAAWLQHRIVLAIRQRAGAVSVREMATRVGVNKSTMGRWLAGQEPLSISALGTLAAAFGVDILDALAVEGDDPIDLLPPPYRPLAHHQDGHITLVSPDEPAWSQLAAAVSTTVADAEVDGSAHLLSGSTLAWALARAAHTLAPTQDLTDLDPDDTSVVTFGLEQPITIAVTLVADSPAAQIRASILRALGHPRDPGIRLNRMVRALVLGPRGARVLEQVLTRSDDGSAIVSATALARAGLGDPIDADVTVVDLAGADAGSARVVLLEITKGRTH